VNSITTPEIEQAAEIAQKVKASQIDLDRKLSIADAARAIVSDHRGSNSQAIDFESVKTYPIFTAKNENHGKSNT
jgi:hypothetical protein